MIPDFTSLNYFNLSPQGDGNQSDSAEQTGTCYFNLSPQKPSQALRAGSPEGELFRCHLPCTKLPPFGGSWHGVSRD